MINAESAFSDLGVNAILGVRLMELLDVSISELSVPKRFHQLKEVIGFFGKYSEDTQRFIISKATRGKQVDKLQHIFEYAQLLKDKDAYVGMLDKVQKEKEALTGNGDEVLVREVSSRLLDIRERIKNVDEEIGIYEK